MDRFTGGCLCGKARIVASGLPYRVGLCHCLDCRKHHGAPFHASAVFPQDAVAILREFANRLGMGRFVLLQTEYFGGVGDQWATVYHGAERVMEVTRGGINKALALVGVVREGNSDEFDTIGLGAHRDFSDLFEKYWDR